MTASAPSANHIAALDGLRGLAALVVLIRHTLNAIPMPSAWRTGLYESPLAILLTSQGAVQLFFVLSGWVLAASIARGPAGPIAWLPFFARRICRIHVPFVCAALVAFALSRFWSIPDPEAVTGWLARSAVQPDFGRFLGSLAFPGKAAGLLPVGWTLEIEMIYSFALPLLVVVARPARGALLLALGVVGLFTPWRIAWYGIDFVLGVLAFQERAAIARGIGRLPVAARAAIPLLGAALLSAPLWYRVAPPGEIMGMSAVEIAVMGVGSVLLVAAALTMPAFARVVGSRACAWLGRISYSIYLLHRPLLTLVAPLVLVPTILASELVSGKGVTNESAAALLAIVMIGSIALSIPFHRFVERPAIALGHRLAGDIETRLGVRRVEQTR